MKDKFIIKINIWNGNKFIPNSNEKIIKNKENVKNINKDR